MRQANIYLDFLYSLHKIIRIKLQTWWWNSGTGRTVHKLGPFLYSSIFGMWHHDRFRIMLGTWRSWNLIFRHQRSWQNIRNWYIVLSKNNLNKDSKFVLLSLALIIGNLYNPLLILLILAVLPVSIIFDEKAVWLT